MNWKQLVEERDEWIAHNFPTNHIPEPGESLIGCIEEMGELAHAHLKEMQSIRGSSEKHVADGQDAIGDLIVYLFGVMSVVGLPSRPPIIKVTDDSSLALRRLSSAVGRLQEVPSVLRIDEVIAYAQLYCSIRGWPFKAIVHDTWREVRKRDWIKYPKDGLTHIGESVEEMEADEAILSEEDKSGIQERAEPCEAPEA